MIKYFSNFNINYSLIRNPFITEVDNHIIQYNISYDKDEVYINSKNIVFCELIHCENCNKIQPELKMIYYNSKHICKWCIKK